MLVLWLWLQLQLSLRLGGVRVKDGIRVMVVVSVRFSVRVSEIALRPVS